MGGHAYWYFVPYQKNLQAALDDLRRSEFAAGRYNPNIPFIAFSEPEFSAQHPGPGHGTIDEAVEAAMEDGTRSILDITTIGASADYGVAAPLSAATLKTLYDTENPTREMVAARMDFLEAIARGQCVYIILYDHDSPTEICFAGYSYD